MATVAISSPEASADAALVIGQQDRCDGDRLGDRTGYAPAAQAFGGHHQVDRMGADAVELLGAPSAP